MARSKGGGVDTIGRGAIVLDLEGNAEQGLEDIGTKLGGLGGNAMAMGAIAAGGVAMVANAAYNVVEAVGDAGLAMIDFGVNIAQTFADIGGEIITVAGSFEGLRAQLEFVFEKQGTNVDNLWASIEDVAKRTAFTTQSVGELVTQLGRSGIADPFSSVTTSAGDSITAIEALNDLAASKGTAGMGLLMGGLQNFLGDPSGNGLTSLRRRMDLPIEMVNKLKERIDSTMNAQDAFNILVEETAVAYGGAGAAMEGTLGFVMAQFEDLKEILFGEIGGDALGVFKPLLIEVQAFLNKIIETEKATHGLRDIFTNLVTHVGAIVTPILHLVFAAIEFLSNNPILTEFLVVLTAAIAATSILSGFFVSMAADMMLMAVKFAIFLAFLPILIVMFLALLPIFAALAAAALYLKVAWDNNFGGIRDTVEKIKSVFSALFELFQNFDGEQSHISMATARRLENNGMLSFTMDAFSALRRMGDAAKGLWEGLKMGFSAAWDSMRPAFVAMGYIPAQIEGADAAMEGGSFIDQINSISPEQWASMGQQIGEAIPKAIKFAETIVTIVSAIQNMIDKFQAFGEIFSGDNIALGAFRMMMSSQGIHVPETQMERNQDAARTGLSRPVGSDEASAANRELMEGIRRDFANNINNSPASNDVAARRHQGNDNYPRFMVMMDGQEVGNIIAQAGTRSNSRLGVQEE